MVSPPLSTATPCGNQRRTTTSLLLTGIDNWLGSRKPFFGSLNVTLAGHENFAKSMMGGILGAIISGELFKYFSGIRQSTGLYFILGLIVLIMIGRIGCFYAGLDDFTYSTATDVAWAVDFGDNIPRHPVQLMNRLPCWYF
jgi:hypothetical protein